MIRNFLEVEAGYKEMADAILHFINSYEIRRGEFEGNEYVIEKLDHENLIIYDEVEEAGRRWVVRAQSIDRKNLQWAIMEEATLRGYELNREFLIEE